jgi:hypothetical protein
MSEELLDEITSINSIYGEDTLVATSDDAGIYALTLPIRSNISLRTEFPADYPDAPPSILGTQHIGDNVAKGEGQQIVDCIRAILAEIYIPGSPCIFDLIEEGGQKLQQLGLDTSSREEEQQIAQTNGQDQDSLGGQEAYSDEHQSLDDLGDAPPWVLSEVVTEKKSVFLARAAEVHSVDEAKTFLRTSLPRTKKLLKLRIISQLGASRARMACNSRIATMMARVLLVAGCCTCSNLWVRGMPWWLSLDGMAVSISDPIASG